MALFQITPNRNCDKNIRAIFDSQKRTGFNEDGARMAYFASLIQDILPVNNAIAAQAQRLGPQNHATQELGLNIIRQFREFDINTMIEAFRDPLTKLGPVADSQAALNSQLGLQMHRYCSLHWNDVKAQSDATLASMIPAQ